MVTDMKLSSKNILSYFEHLILIHKIDNKPFIYFTRYIDDILIIYEHTKSLPHRYVTPTTKFTII